MRDEEGNVVSFTEEDVIALSQMLSEDDIDINEMIRNTYYENTPETYNNIDNLWRQIIQRFQQKEYMERMIAQENGEDLPEQSPPTM